MPKNHLETFGATHLHYHLISELMDTVNRIRIREGAIRSHRPQIITPTYYAQEILDGFGTEANQYIDWLKTHAKDLHILQYGFKIQKTEISEQIVSGNVKEIIEQVKKRISDKNDLMTAVIHGVDEQWDVCLLKFMVDIIRNSAPHNFNELGRRNLLENVNGTPRAVREEIERAFLIASRDKSRIALLGNKLRKFGLFEEYEDRFFALFRKQ